MWFKTIAEAWCYIICTYTKELRSMHSVENSFHPRRGWGHMPVFHPKNTSSLQPYKN